MKQGFIGFGNLAKAIYRGLKEEKEMEFAYFARSKKEEPITYYETMEELVSSSDVLWLCVKPQDLSGILTQLKECNREGKPLSPLLPGRASLT